MPEAIIDYWTTAENWSNTCVEINWNNHPVQKVRIENIPTPEETRQPVIFLNVSIFLTNMASYAESRRVADEATDEVVRAVAYVGEFFISKVAFQQGFFDGQRIEGWGKAGVVYPIVIDRQELPHLCQSLETHLNRTANGYEDYYSMFHAAMQAQGVGRFLLLYLILLTHFGDQQASVEAFIRGEEPSVPTTIHPLHPTRNETVYTRLRNEVGHRRSGTSQENTRLEIEQHMQGLICLVKKMIDRL